MVLDVQYVWHFPYLSILISFVHSINCSLLMFSFTFPFFVVTFCLHQHILMNISKVGFAALSQLPQAVEGLHLRLCSKLLHPAF